MNRIPAYPEVCNGQINPGMTLLDYFAGQAITGLLASESPDMHYSDNMEEKREEIAARHAYKQAVAMVKERNKWCG